MWLRLPLRGTYAIRVKDVKQDVDHIITQRLACHR